MSSSNLDQPVAVRTGEELNTERLLAYLETHLPGAEGPLAVEQFPRGFSNLTYLLRLGQRQVVLRKPPFGSTVKSAHDMGREYRVLSALVESVGKVPRPLLYCQDSEVLGAPFYLMERVEGVILRGDLPPEGAPKPARMKAISESFVDTLVELHAIDYRAAGLEDFGRPEAYGRRQVEGWARRYQKARTDDLPEMESTARWLEEHLPPSSGASLIHNDFKYDNLVLDPVEGISVKAVLDWEMATLGDPLFDLGTSLGYWSDPGDPPELLALKLSPTTLPGNPNRFQLAQRYAAQSGRDVGHLVFYYVFGLFKIAVIVQQIYARYKAGHTQDPRFAPLIEGVRQFGRLATRAIEKGRIDDLF